jgi:thiamine transport system permease protein
VFGTVPALFVAVFFGYPVVSIIGRGLSTRGLDLLRRGEVWQVVWFTAEQAVLSTLLTLVVALPGAYVLHRYDLPGRRVVLALVTVPFVLPTVVVGLAFRALLPSSWIGSLGAILIAHVFFNYAVVVRVVGGLWGQLDPRYEQTARTLGASSWRAFRTVTWPLLRPAVAAAAALVFLFTFTSFGVILVLGGPGTSTLEVEIYRRTAQLLDLPGAAVLAVLQLVVLGIVLLVSARLQAGAAVAQPLRAPSRESLTRPARVGQLALLGAVLLTVVVLLGAPLAALVLRSFRVREGWGLAWWRALGSVDAGTTRFTSPIDSVRVSLQYAVVTGVFAVVVGGLAACAIAYAGRAGRALDAAAMLPLGTSAVTVGFGLLIAFARPPIDLRGSWIMVPLAHTLVAVPLVLRTVLPVLRSIDPRLRQVAATLGARPLRAWATVDVPLLGRSLAVGAGFAVAVSLGEFGATAFLARSDTPTLPVQIVRLLSRPGEVPYGAAMALATVLMVVTASAVLTAEALQGRRRRR